MQLHERIELVALILHQESTDRAIDEMGMEPGSIRVRRDLAIDEFSLTAARIVSGLEAGPRVCNGCFVRKAAFCLDCAEAEVTCGHVPEMMFCAGCTGALQFVKNATEPNAAGRYGYAEFKEWTDGSAAVSLPELRQIAGWRSGWRLQDGSDWPYYDVTDEG